MRFLGLHIEVRNIICVVIFLVVGQLRLITDVLLFYLKTKDNKEGDVNSNLQLLARSHQKTSEMQELEKVDAEAKL